MKEYKMYRDSEIEWLGTIPDDWKVKRIKDVTRTKSGTTPKSSNELYYKNGVHNWIRTTDLNNANLYEVEYKITDLALKECRLAFMPINTILIAMYGGIGTIGKNAVLKKESTINQSICAILPNEKKFHHNYLIYFLKYFRPKWQIFADGTRKDPNIRQDTIKSLFIYHPSLKEQTQIAIYLDKKTKAIDTKKFLLKQKVKKYKELRKSLIYQTITKGLNSSVGVKKCDVKWIGNIPQHWEVKRFNFFGETVKGKNIDLSDKPFKSSSPPLTLEYLRNNSVNHPTYGYSNDKSLRATEEDFVIVWDGAAVGEIIKAKNGYISSTTAKIVIDEKKCFPGYFYHLKNSMDYKLKSIPTGMGIPHLNPTILKNFKCPFPPMDEQIQIADYLDEKTQQIDAIVRNIEEQISRLSELRKTLVSDVVTGKIKVTA